MVPLTTSQDELEIAREELTMWQQYLERWDESTWCTLMHTSDRLPMRVASTCRKIK